MGWTGSDRSAFGVDTQPQGTSQGRRKELGEDNLLASTHDPFLSLVHLTREHASKLAGVERVARFSPDRPRTTPPRLPAPPTHLQLSRRAHSPQVRPTAALPTGTRLTSATAADPTSARLREAGETAAARFCWTYGEGSPRDSRFFSGRRRFTVAAHQIARRAAHICGRTDRRRPAPGPSLRAAFLSRCMLAVCADRRSATSERTYVRSGWTGWTRRLVGSRRNRHVRSYREQPTHGVQRSAAHSGSRGFSSLEHDLHRIGSSVEHAPSRDVRALLLHLFSPLFCRFTSALFLLLHSLLHSLAHSRASRAPLSSRLSPAVDPHKLATALRRNTRNGLSRQTPHDAGPALFVYGLGHDRKRVGRHAGPATRADVPALSTRIHGQGCGTGGSPRPVSLTALHAPHSHSLMSPPPASSSFRSPTWL